MDEGPAKHKFLGLELTMVGALGFFVAVVLLWPAAYDYVSKGLSPWIGPLNQYIPIASNIGKGILSFFVVLAIPFSVACLIAIIYCVEGLKRIREKETEKYDLKVEPAFEEVKSGGNHDLSLRWQKSSNLLGSDNQNDWKQAILEADTMLEDILRGLGYQGEGVGEMLKRVQPGEMKSIDDAWEAHKVRNRIAHDGQTFQLTHHEANQVIQRYKKVFEEFFYI